MIKWILSRLLPSILCLALWSEPTLANTTSIVYQVQLGAFVNSDNAPAAWLRLRTDQPDLLGNLRSRVQRVDIGERVFHLLWAGPLANSEVAKALCAALTARGVDCLVVEP